MVVGVPKLDRACDDPALLCLPWLTGPRASGGLAPDLGMRAGGRGVFGRAWARGAALVEIDIATSVWQIFFLKNFRVWSILLLLYRRCMMQPDVAFLTLLGFYLFLGPILLFYRYVWPGKHVASWVTTLPIWWFLGVVSPLLLLIVAAAFLLYNFLTKEKIEPQEEPPASLARVIKDKINQGKNWIECPSCCANIVVREQDISKLTICNACGTKFRIVPDMVFVDTKTIVSQDKPNIMDVARKSFTSGCKIGLGIFSLIIIISAVIGLIQWMVIDN